jgi:hypothetical protein
MTTALAIVAIAISLGAICVSVWNARSDSRSATAAEDSAVTSRQAADHARESVEQAKRSAESGERNALAAEEAVKHADRGAKAAESATEIARVSAEASNVSARAAADLLRVELDREHDDYAPQVAGKWVFEPRGTSPHVNVLTYRFKLDRNYAILAMAVGMNGMGQTDCVVTAPGQQDGDWRVHVEDWTPDREHSAFRKLILRFWPQQAQEGRARPWSCRCGVRLDPGTHAGHWDVEVDVVPPKPRKVVVLK